MRKYKNRLTLVFSIIVAVLLLLFWLSSGDSQTMKGYAKRLDALVQASPEKREQIYSEIAEEFVPKFSDIAHSKSHSIETRKYAAHQLAALAPHAAKPEWALGSALLFVNDNIKGEEGGRERAMLYSTIKACLPQADESEKAAMQRMLASIAETSGGLFEDGIIAVYPLTYADYVIIGAKAAPEMAGKKTAELAAARYFRTDTLAIKDGTPFELETKVQITPKSPPLVAEIKSDERTEMADSVKALNMLGEAEIKKAFHESAQKPASLRMKISAENKSGGADNGIIVFNILKDCGREVAHSYSAEYLLKQPRKKEKVSPEDILNFTGLKDASTFLFNDLSNAEVEYIITGSDKAE